MEDKINDGGPAFPAVFQGETRSDAPGMTLRDYFAAKAMQGLCTQPGESFDSEHEIAAVAYAMADAMLAARGGQ